MPDFSSFIGSLVTCHCLLFLKSVWDVCGYENFPPSKGNPWSGFLGDIRWMTDAIKWQPSKGDQRLAECHPSVSCFTCCVWFQCWVGAWLTRERTRSTVESLDWAQQDFDEIKGDGSGIQTDIQIASTSQRTVYWKTCLRPQ